MGRALLCCFLVNLLLVTSLQAYVNFTVHEIMSMLDPLLPPMQLCRQTIRDLNKIHPNSSFLLITDQSQERLVSAVRNTLNFETPITYFYTNKGLYSFSDEVDSPSMAEIKKLLRTLKNRNLIVLVFVKQQLSFEFALRVVKYELTQRVLFYVFLESEEQELSPLDEFSQLNKIRDRHLQMGIYGINNETNGANCLNLELRLIRTGDPASLIHSERQRLHKLESLDWLAGALNQSHIRFKKQKMFKVYGVNADVLDVLRREKPFLQSCPTVVIRTVIETFARLNDMKSEIKIKPFDISAIYELSDLKAQEGKILQPFLTDYEIIVTKEPDLEAPIMQMLLPFDTRVWIMIAISMVLIPALAYWISKIQSKYNDNPILKSITLMRMYRELIGQGQEGDNQTKTPIFFFLFGFWILLVLIFQVGYGEVIYSILVTPRQPFTIDTFQDLTTGIEQYSFYWMVLEGSSLLRRLRNLDNRDNYRLAKASRVLKKGLPETVLAFDRAIGKETRLIILDKKMTNSENVFKAVLNGSTNLAFVTDREAAQSFQFVKRDMLHVSKESFASESFAFSVPHGSHFYEGLQKMQSWITECGITTHEADICKWKHFDDSKAPKFEPEKDLLVTRLKSVKPVFYFMTIGWIVGGVVFIGELIFHQHKDKIRQAAGTKFAKAKKFTSIRREIKMKEESNEEEQNNSVGKWRMISRRAASDKTKQPQEFKTIERIMVKPRNDCSAPVFEA